MERAETLIMNTIYAEELFQDKSILNTLHFDGENNLTLDFSRVHDFSLNNLYTLLDIQKLALFNNIKLHLKNTTPSVDKVLFETGIYKTLNGFTTNPILAAKRLSFT